MKIFSVWFFCVFLPPLLNISASVRSISFLSFIEPICAWNIPLLSLIFLTGSLVFPILLFSSPLLSLIFLTGSLVFPILLFSSISLHWGRLSYLSLLAILWNSTIKWVFVSFSPLLFASLLFTATCKASSDSHFAFLHFFFLGMVLIPVSCIMLQTSIHSSSGTLSDLIPWIYLSLPLYNCKGFDLDHTWMV